jgi:hypothetical protein
MDDASNVMMTGVGAAGMIVPMIIGLVMYIYIGYSLMVIAGKTGVENGWWGFVPILNILLLIKIAEKPMWWILLFLIPLVNVIIMILLWMKIAERRGKPGWIGILMIVPVANVIVPGYLAFTE